MQTVKPDVDEQELQRFAAMGSRGSRATISKPIEAAELEEEQTAETEEEEEKSPTVIFQTKKKQLWALPLTKLVMIGGVVGFVLLVLFAVTKDLMGETKPSSSSTVASNPTPSPTASDPQTENSKLQTEVAMGRAGVELDRINSKFQDKGNARTRSSQVSPTSTPQVTPVPTYTPPPAVIETPRTQPSSYTPPDPPARPTPPIATPSPSFPTREKLPRVVQKVEDPYQKWQRLSSLGNFSSSTASPGDERMGKESSISNSSNPTLVASGGIGQPPANYRLQSAQPVSFGNQSTNTQSVNYQPVNNSISSVGQLVVGTHAAGELATPVAWSGSSQFNSGPSSGPSMSLRIRLLEPLGTIPAHSYLVAQIVDNDNAGLLQLSVTSVQLNENGQLIEKSLPSGALQIFGKGGRPLQAKYHGPRRGGSSLLSRLGGVAAVVNNSNSLSNLYALEALQQSDHSDSPTYYSLETGTPVVVYVNQTFSF